MYQSLFGLLDALICGISKVSPSLIPTSDSTEPIQQLLNYLEQLIQKQNPRSLISVPADKGFHVIDQMEIIYLKADGSYTQLILTDGKKEMISRRLSIFERNLDPTHFCRIHRSYMINLNHLRGFSRKDNRVSMSNGEKLEVSKRRLATFIQSVDQVSQSPIQWEYSNKDPHKKSTKDQDK